MPRDNVNDSMHSTAAKKFSKASRPPCFSVFEAIIASVAATKNDGRGAFLYDVISAFGHVCNAQIDKCNKIQSQCIYNWHRVRSDRHKKLRARKRKKYIDRQRKREKNRAKHDGVPISDHYAKNIDNIPNENFDVNMVDVNTDANISTPTEPPKKKAKYSCLRCGKEYKYKASYDKHVKPPLKCRSKSK